MAHLIHLIQIKITYTSKLPNSYYILTDILKVNFQCQTKLYICTK